MSCFCFCLHKKPSRNIDPKGGLNMMRKSAAVILCALSSFPFTFCGALYLFNCFLRDPSCRRGKIAREDDVYKRTVTTHSYSLL